MAGVWRQLLCNTFVYLELKTFKYNYTKGYFILALQLSNINLGVGELNVDANTVPAFLLCRSSIAVSVCVPTAVAPTLPSLRSEVFKPCVEDKDLAFCLNEGECSIIETVAGVHRHCR